MLSYTPLRRKVKDHRNIHRLMLLGLPWSLVSFRIWVIKDILLHGIIGNWVRQILKSDWIKPLPIKTGLGNFK